MRTTCKIGLFTLLSLSFVGNGTCNNLSANSLFTTSKNNRITNYTNLKKEKNSSIVIDGKEHSINETTSKNVEMIKGLLVVDSTVCPNFKIDSCLKKYEYKTSNYKNGVLDNYYNYVIVSAKQIKGVYSFYNRFVSRPLLESGGYDSSYTQTHKSLRYSSETVLFESKVSMAFESRITAGLSLNESGLGASMVSSAESKSSFTSVYEAWYSSRKTAEVTTNLSFSLTENMAKYCPEGYAMTIGTVAEYYLITLGYRNVVKTIFGDKKDAYKTMTIVLANEMNLIDTFVYQNISNLGGEKYYLQ